MRPRPLILRAAQPREGGLQLLERTCPQEQVGAVICRRLPVQRRLDRSFVRLTAARPCVDFGEMPTRPMPTGVGGGLFLPNITDVYAVMYTARMSKTVPVREFRSHLADLLDEVADRREHVTITRHGRPSAVVVPVDEYQALEETAEILSDDATLAAIRQGLDDLAGDEVVPLEQVRREHAAREPR